MEKVIQDLRSIKTYLASQAAEAAKDGNKSAREGLIEGQKAIAKAVALLEKRGEQPKIVRCKDCKRSFDVSDISPDLPYMCEKFGRLLFGIWAPSFHDGDWFCADGKRREKQNDT